jgi:hypothetical protein
MATLDVDDAEPSHSDGDAIVDVVAGVIRAAMPDCVAHRSDAGHRFAIAT